MKNVPPWTKRCGLFATPNVEKIKHLGSPCGPCGLNGPIASTGYVGDKLLRQPSFGQARLVYAGELTVSGESLSIECDGQSA